MRVLNTGRQSSLAIHWLNSTVNNTSREAAGLSAVFCFVHTRGPATHNNEQATQGGAVRAPAGVMVATPRQRAKKEKFTWSFL